MTESDNGKPVDETPSPETSAAEAAAKEQAAADAKAAKAKAVAEAEAAKEPWERDPATPVWEEADDNPLVEALRDSFSNMVVSARSFAGDLVVEVEARAIREVCSSLKEEHGYKLLVDICGSHFAKREDKQLEIVYIFHNLESNQQIRLKVRVDSEVEVPSVTPVFAGANWTEREVYDMYGVRFADHPDMTRILLWEGFNGYPLLKSFPVEGIDTGAAIYPETYSEDAGPIAGTGTGWKPPEPVEDVVEEPTETPAGEDS
jgi:NADH-quinone oxidoreductase subunit C